MQTNCQLLGCLNVADISICVFRLCCVVIQFSEMKMEFPLTLQRCTYEAATLLSSLQGLQPQKGFYRFCYLRWLEFEPGMCCATERLNISSLVCVHAYLLFSEATWRFPSHLVPLVLEAAFVFLSPQQITTFSPIAHTWNYCGCCFLIQGNNWQQFGYAC